MPYIIKSVKNGFKVCKRDNPKKCFSKKPLTKKMAEKQRTAINISELKGKGKREDLIKKAEEKVGKIPERYVPKSLTISDLKKQLDSIVKEVKRPKLKSFKSEESKWTKKAREYFGEGNTGLEEMAEKMGKTKKRQKEILTGLKQIKKKGEGAYYSSGSRPNQTPESWGFGRVFSVLFGGPSREIDIKIVNKHDIPLLNKTGRGRKVQKGIREFLLSKNIVPENYLNIMREKAEKAGYDEENLFLSDKKPYKLMIIDEDEKPVYFGRVPYGDFEIYKLLEKKGDEPLGTARKKRRAYRARATKIKGTWKANPFSPNNLAIRILW